MKVVTPNLKKLDNRSRMLVHLGTEPGSKAYRLYDPTNRKIVVSRDVIFDENKMWNWRNNSKDSGGTFNVVYGTFGNRGINDDDVGRSETSDGSNKAIVTHDDTAETRDSEEEHDEVEDNEEDTLRRSTRERKKPAYLDDYILLAELDGERLLLSLNDEPWDYEEAKDQMVGAMLVMMKSLR